MRVRLSVFLLLDKQNLVKKKENNKHQRYTQAPLLYVFPFFRSTTFWRHFWSTFVWKNTAKFDINFLFYNLSVEPEKEHGGIDASNQQSQRES